MFFLLVVLLAVIGVCVAVAAPSFIDSMPPAYGRCPCGAPLDKHGRCKGGD